MAILSSCKLFLAERNWIVDTKFILMCLNIHQDLNHNFIIFCSQFLKTSGDALLQYIKEAPSSAYQTVCQMLTSAALTALPRLSHMKYDDTQEHSQIENCLLFCICVLFSFIDNSLFNLHIFPFLFFLPPFIYPFFRPQTCFCSTELLKVS